MRIQKMVMECWFIPILINMIPLLRFTPLTPAHPIFTLFFCTGSFLMNIKQVQFLSKPKKTFLYYPPTFNHVDLP